VAILQEQEDIDLECDEAVVDSFASTESSLLTLWTECIGYSISEEKIKKCTKVYYLTGLELGLPVDDPEYQQMVQKIIE
jgi:hypothetical protein